MKFLPTPSNNCIIIVHFLVVWIANVEFYFEITNILLKKSETKIPRILFWFFKIVTAYFFFEINPHKISTINEPPMANNKLIRLNSFIVPNPKRVPTHPPIKAPAIPISIVTIHPPGSFPGFNHLAIAPAIRPRAIHDKIPIIFAFWLFERFLFSLQK